MFFWVLMVLLFSCREKESGHRKAEWITQAFVSLESDAYPKVKAISWWHENFDNSFLRVDSSPESLAAYQNGVASQTFVTQPVWENEKLVASESGIYHAAFPDFGGTEDVVDSQRISAFESLVGKDIVWAYFSDNWYDDIHFPTMEVTTISHSGKIPFIRIMPRTNFDEGGPDPNYSLQKIIDGVYDVALVQWAQDAANMHIPILVEFGTEVNGDWFSWNGKYNGDGETTGYGDGLLADGPERFRDAYRYVVDLCKAQGAENLTWFFHVDAYSEPDVAWNAIKNYYPGDDYVDWLGVSIYGPQEKGETYQSFSEIMDDVYPQLTALGDKPIAVLEFAITELD